MARPSIALVVAVLLAACVSSSSSTDDPATRASGSEDRTLLYTCGFDVAFPAALFDRAETDLGRTPPGRAVRLLAADDPLLPETGWHLGGGDAASATFLAWVPGDQTFVYARVELDAARWQVASWGGCTPGLWEPDAGAADWTLAPGQRLTATTTSFAVDVTERACTGGRSSEGRVKPPILVYAADAILVAFTVRSLPGAHTCPGNPATRVIVELRESVGPRRVLDAGTLPPSVRD